MLAACSSKPEPHATSRYVDGYFKVGNPYKIRGEWYRPEIDPDYDEEGVASWYGPTFHGKKTANGEVYDQYAMTAAHKTLPMPSVVRVTRRDNGRSIIVRVNDRGPYVDGRVIDLSRAAAEELGMRRAGLAPVRVQILRDETVALWEKSRHFRLADWMTEEEQRRPQTVQLARKAPEAQAWEDNQNLARASATRAPMPVATAAVKAPPVRAVRTVPVEEVEITEIRAASVAASPVPAKPYQVVSRSMVAPPAGAMQTGYDAYPGGRADEMAGGESAMEYVIQVGAFSSPLHARTIGQKLAAVADSYVEPVEVNGLRLHRLRFAPVASRPQADALLEAAHRYGYRDARIVAIERQDFYSNAI